MATIAELDTRIFRQSVVSCSYDRLFQKTIGWACIIRTTTIYDGRIACITGGTISQRLSSPLLSSESSPSTFLQTRHCFMCPEARSEGMSIWLRGLGGHSFSFTNSQSHNSTGAGYDVHLKLARVAVELADMPLIGRHRHIHFINLLI